MFRGDLFHEGVGVKGLGSVGVGFAVLWTFFLKGVGVKGSGFRG